MRLAFFLSAFFSSLFLLPLMAQINFTNSELTGLSISRPSSVAFGPDGRLYIAELKGNIYAVEVVRNAANNYQVVSSETISLIKNIPNHDDDGSLNTYYKDRQLTGLLVKGTASNPVIYASSSDPRIGGSSVGDRDLDTNSGYHYKIDLEWEFMG